MARAISVKIPTANVIAMIEEKIAEITEDVATYPARKAQYQVDQANYARAITSRLGKLIIDGGTALLSNEDTDSGIRVRKNYNNSTEIVIGKDLVADIECPVAPTDPEPRGFFGGRGSGYSTKREELEKTLRLLRMTEQETITSSAYNSVLDLL